MHTHLTERKFLKFLLFLLFITILPPALSSRAEMHPSKPYLTDVGQYNYAEFLMDEGSFEIAAREFSRLIEEFPASPLLDKAQLRRGEAFLKAERYREAELEFRLFLFNFADSPLARRAAKGFMEAKEKLREMKAKSPRPPLNISPGSDTLRAVQVMFFDGRTYGEIERELRDLKEAGVNTVIVRAFHNRGDRFWPLVNGMASKVPGPHVKDEAGVYFSTSVAPVVADILPGVAELAHRNGLKIFAWMTTRYADYGLEERGDLACTGYDLSTRSFYRCKGLDVFNDEAVNHIAGIFRDLAEVDIDGILFQDDLVLRHNEGFGHWAESRFFNDTGIVLDPESLYVRTGSGGKVHYTSLFWKWARWKNKRLLHVAESLRDVVKGRNPHVSFAINLMYENLTNPPYALAWLSQDLVEAKKTGFDYYSIMAYHRQMSKELGKSAETVNSMIGDMARNASRVVGEPEKVLIKVQTIDWNTGVPLSDSEVASIIRSVKRASPVSLAVVPYRSDFPFHVLATGSRVAVLSGNQAGH